MNLLMEAQSRVLRPSFGQTTKDYYVFGHFSCQLIPSIFATRWHLEMRASFHRRWATLRASPTGINQPTVEIRRRSPLSNFPGKVGAIVVALGGGENVHVMPFLLHSITLDWSIGLIPEFWFHLTNSQISRLDQTPKPLYFFLKKSRFSELGKKGKNWSK